jgi:hypothetical protein
MKTAAARVEPGYQLGLPSPISDATQRAIADCLTLLAAFSFPDLPMRRDWYERPGVFPTKSFVARLILSAAAGSNITLPSDVQRAVEKYGRD